MLSLDRALLVFDVLLDHGQGCSQAGARVIRVRPHGTSQTCHRCGSTAEGQRESQAVFRCADPSCGWTGNADTNAAIVIKYRGQEVASQDVEPNATRQAAKRQNRKTAA